MATENATERHTTANEQEPVVAMHWQSGDSDNNGSDNSGSYKSPEDELSYLLHKRGAQKCSTILVAELDGLAGFGLPIEHGERISWMEAKKCLIRSSSAHHIIAHIIYIMVFKLVS
jgi:hypothetical protein